MAEVHLFVEFLYQLTHFVNVEEFVSVITGSDPSDHKGFPSGKPLFRLAGF